MEREILVVDDEPHVKRILKVSLEKKGYKIVSASNGEEALDIIRMKAPDILITDINMPRMSGKQLCETIHKDIKDRKFLIFLMTSKLEYEEKEWIKGIPDLEFLEKPLSLRKLSSRLEKCFENEIIREPESE